MYNETRYILSENVVFVLGDKLSASYDAAISLYMVATKPKSKKMVSAINFCNFLLTTSCSSRLSVCSSDTNDPFTSLVSISLLDIMHS